MEKKEMHWFLVISLIGTDEVLIKQTASKSECTKMQREFDKTMGRNVKMQIERVSCEEGEVLETYKANEEEVL